MLYGIIDEIAGGINFYAHESLAYKLVEHLCWNCPQKNDHIDSINHAEWDGYQCRGWDIHDHMSMDENLKLNNSSRDQLFAVSINDVLYGFATDASNAQRYAALLENYLSTTN
ncbi:hypothetical protein [Photobacterium kishitanii]|uniref:Uncharacterized protein n=1 Tax=Photobacterium kishitanii TaxID=318456 RepID=A0A2T3KKU7_9GAMM|nr:hypothetical protein [Photobacterium kishitanii]PSV00332.1 hypothetical protein C9J27_04190 [Photobacterium kishitanii]